MARGNPQPRGRPRQASPQRAGQRPGQKGGQRGGQRASQRPGQPSQHRRSSNLGGDQVEGRQAVRELLAANRRRVYEVLLAPLASARDADLDDEYPDEYPGSGQRNNPRNNPRNNSGDNRRAGRAAGRRFSSALAEIADLAAARRIPVREVRASRLAEIARTEAPQGVVARAEPIEPVPLEQLAQPATQPAARPTSSSLPPLLVAVDGITDPANLGAILRTAEVAGATGAVVPRHRAVRLTPAATKAAAGAIEHLPVALVGGLPAALAQLSEAGMWVVGLDARAQTGLVELAVANESMVLVLGAEGRGLSPLVRKRCHQLVSIPRRGRIESLNVAAAAAVALYEVDRARALPSTLTPG